MVLSADKKVIKIWDRNSVRNAVFDFYAPPFIAISAFNKFCLSHACQRPK